MSAAELWLSPEEVEMLTGRKRWRAQCRQLTTMGVPFRPNGVGRPLVERTAVLTTTKPAKKPAAPNWDGIRGAA